MKRKLKILAVVNDLGAVAQVRIISPLNYLKVNKYIEYEIFDLSKKKFDYIDYVPDIVIIQRLSNIVFYEFIKFLKSKGSKIIFELDDNLFELPPKNPNYTFFSNPNTKRDLLEYIWLADHLVVSTEDLKTYFQIYNKSITVVPNQIDEEMFNNTTILKTNKSQIRIGFAGTITHREDFIQVEDALKDIQSKYKEKVKIVFINMIPESFVFDKNVEYFPGKSLLNKFYQLLLDANIDIGLAPLAYNKFNMGKSDLKFLEYGISGIAGIYSNFGPYKKVVKDNETGLLVNGESSKAWVSKLSYLIENPSEIDRIKTNAFNYVSEKRTIRKNYDNWLNVFTEITKTTTTIENRTRMKKESIERVKRENKKRTKLKSSNASVSIIIPVFNKVEFTKKCIKSIYTHTTNIDFEIIIVDNGSTDGTNDYLEQLSKSHTNVRVIRNKQNLGFAKANNQAAEIAEGKYLLLLNNDTVVHPGWLKSLIETIQQKDNIGIVGSKLLYPDGTIQHAGVAIVKDEVNNIEINPWHIGHRSKDEGQYNNIKEMKTVTAACMLIRKDVFFECDGLDEQFWNGYEDVDFCFKVINKNYKILYQPSSVITHFESQSGGERFIKENDNLKLLLKRWAGKITPDIILRSDGSFINYNSASIIIVTYNSEDVISSCIDSLKKTLRKDDEVVIVDNNSRDNTIKIVEKSIKNLSQIKIIKSEENIGFSAGCNLGIKNSSRPFVVLLNPDTIVTENWLEKMTSALQQEKTAAVGPVSNYAAGMQNIAGYIDQSELNTFNIQTISKEVENRFSKKVVETKLLIGFCMMIKRSILDKFGMLDEKLFLGNDDLDLSWRFRLNGYKLFVAVDTFIFHKGQVSFKTEKKIHTNKLVQESTDILYEKLVNHYGEENVPKPEELWGMNWFTPTNAKFNNKSKLLDKKSLPLSIVIPTFNQWDYTKQTIESIQKFTEKKHEIIIVDNASSDNTIRELKNYQNVKVISNSENLGFPKAVNHGILEAQGDYILIANNDIIFTENWFERMVQIAESDEKIGIVGPISNSVSGRQLDKNAKYVSIPEMHKYAAKIRKENKGQFFQFPRVAFLCTLIKKEVIDKIGGLDERYSPGNFEDDDFCLRTQMAGYKTVIATDVFIHHYGSVSFKANGENEYAKRIEINKQKFIDKWGADPEEIWIKGKQPKQREIKFPINSDPFIQHIERAFLNIENDEHLLAIKNLEIAIENFNKSERKGFENLSLEELIVILGNLYFALNNVEKAKESFEAALNENPNSSPACLGLGDIFLSIDELEAAKTMYEWAVKNDEKNELARQKLAAVNKSLSLDEKDFSLTEQE